jgi:hypothetical protein
LTVYGISKAGVGADPTVGMAAAMICRIEVIVARVIT